MFCRSLKDIHGRYASLRPSKTAVTCLAVFFEPRCCACLEYDMGAQTLDDLAMGLLQLQQNTPFDVSLCLRQSPWRLFTRAAIASGQKRTVMASPFQPRKSVEDSLPRSTLPLTTKTILFVGSSYRALHTIYR